MNVETGTDATQFLFWEHINGIFVARRQAHGKDSDKSYALLRKVTFYTKWKNPNLISSVTRTP